MNDDEHWMRQAITCAVHAKNNAEIPVGAVMVRDGVLIAKGCNAAISQQDPTAHAEIVAMRCASKSLNNYRLLETTLYVTLEPCAMCLGAFIHGRIKRLVFGAYDPKAGAQSVFHLLEHPGFNHKITYTGGVLAEECGRLLRQFFQKRR